MSLGKKHNALHRAAADIVPELTARLQGWLASDMMPDSVEHRELMLTLWDNKVGILRVLEGYIAITQSRADT